MAEDETAEAGAGPTRPGRAAAGPRRRWRWLPAGLPPRVVHAPLATTGGRVWEAAEALAGFLSRCCRLADTAEGGGETTDEAEAVAEAVAEAEEGPAASGCACAAVGRRLRRRGVRVLELGAGCGWLGLCLARALPEAGLVVLTEQAGPALRHTQRNVAANRDGRVATAELDWGVALAHPGRPVRVAPRRLRWKDGGKERAAEEGPGAGGSSYEFVPDGGEVSEFDVVLGSDLVYNDEGMRALPRLLATLLAASPACLCLYAHTKRRFETLDVDFYNELADAGLRVTELEAPGAPPRQASPPPLLERLEAGDLDATFPPKRVAVLRIERAVGKGRPEPYR